MKNLIKHAYENAMLTTSVVEWHTCINLNYKFKDELSQAKKEALHTEQMNYMKPFMSFYQYLLDNDLIDLFSTKNLIQIEE